MKTGIVNFFVIKKSPMEKEFLKLKIEELKLVCDKANQSKRFS